MSSINNEGQKLSEFGERFAEACGTAEPARIQRLLNVSYQAAKNYLHGRMPDARVLITIAERTPYSIHWLLTGQGDKFSFPRRDDTPILARQISELIKQEVEVVVNEALTKAQGPSGSRTIVLRADEVKSETEKNLTSNTSKIR
jgi:hypothetical protein